MTGPVRALRLTVILVTLSLVASAATQAPPSLDISEFTLDNGLRVFVVERTASPTFAAIYQFGVGAALDPKGKSGIAHLLEHMMFKGSTNIGGLDAAKEAELMARLGELWDELHLELDKRDNPFAEADEKRIGELETEIEKVAAEHKGLIVKNEYNEVLSRAGGVGTNAWTNNDTTTYVTQLPANRLELFFKLESDRLLNPVFREFFSERDVVQAERRQGLDSSPQGKMWEALIGQVFTGHPYGSPVIGWPADLQRLTRGDAEAYFKRYYSPSNCVMALVGDVDVAEVKRLAEKYFASWEQQALPRLHVTAEETQEGERRRVVQFDARPQLMIGWATVREGHADTYPLDVLSSVLGGLWSSRMDKNIVQAKRLAASVYTNHRAQRFGGLFVAAGTVNEGHDVHELEAAIKAEVEAIIEHGISDLELERAKITTEVGRVRSLKSNFGQAIRIVNAVGMAGDPGYMDQYARRIASVTSEQVQEVATRYLDGARASVIELESTEGVGGREHAGTQFEHNRGAEPGKRGQAHSVGFGESMEMIRASAPVSLTVPEIGGDVDRIVLDSGITVFIKEDQSAPSIDMAFSWTGGSNTTALDGLAAFDIADQLLSEGGTSELDPIRLQEVKDELGLRFSIRLGATQSAATFWSLSRNFDQTFALALAMLKTPRLDPTRLETIKGQYIEMMRRRYDNPWWGAWMVHQHVFNHDHARLGYQSTRNQIEAITGEEVRQLWRTYLGRDNLFVTVVGDFDKDEMIKAIEAGLGSWQEAVRPEREYITREPVIRPGVYNVEKELPSVAINVAQHLALDRTAPQADHAALEILNNILGGSGFRSRLMERLRSDEGLTYGIYSYIGHQGREGQPGQMYISYQTGKDTVVQSINSVLEEYRKIVLEEVAKAEVEEQIEAWRNRFIFRYTNDFYSVSRLMHNELDDRSYKFDQEELAAVQKVTVADVQRVAKAFLEAKNLTIGIFGALAEEDRKALDEQLGLTVLAKNEVFSGGYDVEAKAEEEDPAATQ